MAGALAMLSGCAIDVDLSSAPPSADVGDPVTFDISVRNRATCPVGGVIAVLVPFVPRNFFIDQISDPEVRAALSAFVDAFCSGQDVEPPDGAGGCRIENGDLICDIIPAMSLPPLPETAVANTAGNQPITCSSDGTKVTCRFPRAIVEQAQQASSQASPGTLQCASGDAVAVCGALLLDPGETKSAQVVIDAPYGGQLRNWVVSFPTVQGGVCDGGLLRNRPCSDDDDCPTSDCAPGVCDGGTRDGFGCDIDDDCTGGGSCTECEVPDDGQLLSGVACTNTAVAINGVPAASNWGLVGVVAALVGVGMLAVRRMRQA
jgi:hypothetical protein